MLENEIGDESSSSFGLSFFGRYFHRANVIDCSRAPDGEKTTRLTPTRPANSWVHPIKKSDIIATTGGVSVAWDSNHLIITGSWCSRMASSSAKGLGGYDKGISGIDTTKVWREEEEYVEMSGLRRGRYFGRINTVTVKPRVSNRLVRSRRGIT